MARAYHIPKHPRVQVVRFCGYRVGASPARRGSEYPIHVVEELESCRVDQVARVEDVRGGVDNPFRGRRRRRGLGCVWLPGSIS
jgi:hypothetical protein